MANSIGADSVFFGGGEWGFTGSNDIIGDLWLEFVGGLARVAATRSLKNYTGAVGQGW